MKSACVGVLSIIEMKKARWNIEIVFLTFFINVSNARFHEKRSTGIRTDTGRQTDYFTDITYLIGVLATYAGGPKMVRYHWCSGYLFIYFYSFISWRNVL